MKKFITGICLVGLFGLGAIYLSSCAQQAGPLSPSLNLLGTSNSNNADLPSVSAFTAPASVSQTVKVRFNFPMDGSSMTTSTVQLYVLNNTADPATDGKGETQVTDFTMSYNPALFELTLTPTTTWENDRRYHLVLSPGIRSAAGAQFDGNYNNIPESWQFDNYHSFFNLGAPIGIYGYSTDPAVEIESAVISHDGSNWGMAPGGSYGDIRATYSYVTITVTFDPDGFANSDWQMDVSTLMTGPTTLSSNVVFTDSNGTPVTPLSLTVTSTSGYANDTIEGVFQLQPSTQYVMQLLGGLTGIRSRTGGVVVLDGGYLDGDDDNVAEAVDNTEEILIQTQNAAAADLPRLYVSGVSWTQIDEDQRYFTLTFSIPAGVGSGTLNPACVTNQVFRLENDSDNRAIVPAALELDNSNPPNPTVRVYVPMKFVDSTSNTSKTVRVIVTNQARTSEDLYMDQDNDGVVLTEDDHYRSGGYSIVSYGN